MTWRVPSMCACCLFPWEGPVNLKGRLSIHLSRDDRTLSWRYGRNWAALCCAVQYSNHDARIMSLGSGIFCDDRYLL